MRQEALFGQVGIFGARTSVVGIGIDADAAARREEADDLNVFGVHQRHKILHDLVDTVFVEITMVAEGEEIELQALRLHHALTGDVENLDLRKVGLTGDRTERRKLRTVELHPVIVVRMLVDKRFQHLRRIVLTVFGLLTKGLQPFLLS